jgi:hypothetical protein
MECGKVGAICGVLSDQGDPWTVGAICGVFSDQGNPSTSVILTLLLVCSTKRSLDDLV